MSNKIIASIILPLLNASEDVRGVFESINGQIGIDKSLFEIVVVNDGSNDNTFQEIEKNKHLLNDFDNFIIINNPQRTGHVQARLSAALKAKGNFLLFIDKRTRPNKDYISQMLAKGRNIVVGDVYMDKSLSAWDRVLCLVRKKLYFPYFNHDFNDIELDKEAYRTFKNKGGGGALLVLRRYYLQVAKSFKTNLYVNDDSMLISGLLTIEPLLKTADAKTLYLNRTRFGENIAHLYARGPKFVDYYINPSTRFFPLFLGVVIAFFVSLALLVIAPIIFLYELLGLACLIVLASIYLAEDLKDFTTCLIILPITFISFSAGIIKGFFMKIFRLY